MHPTIRIFRLRLQARTQRLRVATKLVWYRLRGWTAIRVNEVRLLERMTTRDEERIAAKNGFIYAVEARELTDEFTDWADQNGEIEFMNIGSDDIYFIFKDKNSAFAFKMQWL